MAGQDVRVKSVTLTTDPMPRYMQRTDLNGEICGLVKVIIPGARVSFEGNLIGNPEFKTSEYWCWLTPGTRFLKVKVPGFAPLMIDFKDFFDNGIRGMRIYEVVLVVPQPLASTSGRVLKGTVNIEGLTHRYKRSEEEEKAEAINGLTLYHNLHGDSYKAAVDLTGDPFAIEGEKKNNCVEYLLGNVNFGDSLTFKFKNPHYADRTVKIPAENVEKSLFDLKLFRKRYEITLKLIDVETGEPVDSAEISRFKDRPEVFGSKYDFLGMTDKDGIFVIRDAVDGKRMTVYAWKDGYGGIFNLMEITPYRNEDVELRIYGETASFNLKGGENVVVTLPDDTTVSPDSRGTVDIYRPVYPFIITISAPGYKTLKVRLSGKPVWNASLKMKKGNPSQVECWNMYKGKFVKTKLPFQ